MKYKLNLDIIEIPAGELNRLVEAGILIPVEGLQLGQNGRGGESWPVKEFPQVGDKYFCVTSRGTIRMAEFTRKTSVKENMKLRKKFGNVFRTKEEAEAFRDKIKAL